MPKPTESTHRRVTLVEHGTADVTCSAVVAARMHGDGHVTVTPLAQAGHYKLRAKHKVGIMRYGDLELRILPKLKVGRLLYLAGFHDKPDAWRELETLLDEASDPLSAVARALIFQTRRALSPTPLQGYVTHEAAERRFRGRLLFDKQLSRRSGLQIPVELRYDEYELGIPENRVVKSALRVVGGFVTDPELRRNIRHLKARLDGVEPWPIGQPLPDFSFGRLNRRYRGALALARLVLERRSLEYPEQRRRGMAFLFNMPRVFEAFLEAALAKELKAYGGSVINQARMHLDVARELPMKPDITWWRGGECRAVLDAKYKRTKSDEFPNADAYQMLAYCTRLGLDRGYLVYADLSGSEPGTTVINNAGVMIHVTSIDLSDTISNLQQSVRQLAAKVAAPVLGC